MKNNFNPNLQTITLMLKSKKYRDKKIKILTNSLFHNNIQFKRSRVEGTLLSKMLQSISSTEAPTKDHPKTLKKILSIR